MSAQDLNSRMPPNNLEAERMVLGSMIRHNATIPDVVQLLTQEAFYHDHHQKLYAAVMAVYDRRQMVDLVLLANHLKEVNQLDDVGQYGYLVELWDGSPTGANVEHYAEIVRDKYLLRSLLVVGQQIAQSAMKPDGPAVEVMDAAERQIFELAHWGQTGKPVMLQEAISEAFDRIDKRAESGRTEYSGIPTGFIDLDDKLAGLQDSELVLVAARPSVGKTAFGLALFRNLALAGHAVFFVSLEMSRTELAERLLACHAQVDSHKLRRGMLNDDDSRKLFRAGEELAATAPMVIDDTPGQGMLRIVANARRLKAKHNLKAVFIDYLQLVEPDNRDAPRQEQVAGISRRLKFLAKELRIPVVAMAQVNRSSENRADNRPRLADLRESGSLEADADTVMLLHRPDLYSPGESEGVMEIIIGKQRNGPTGEVTLTFQKQWSRFENYAPGFPEGGS